ncbi:MAG: aminotransferase class V-fold PLP-dependent enzyme [Cyclobacteriaceae bacterium]|nr:aminotransferase class V-fold PLP-dependent enzyme [Cyclobacteriaceae bacterium]
MISFYPGPSRIYPKVSRYLTDACREGIVSINHRSDAFMDLYRQTVKLFREKLFLPSDYALYFVSSATECWEIIAQSLTAEKSVHLFNGAFGQKWYDYATHLVNTRAISFDIQQALQPAVVADADVICITQNETSNGTQVKPKIIQKIRQLNPDVLLAVDATSSMGGINLPWHIADIWFASVQKCFGLPAGMGVLICSPAAIRKAESVNNTSHYNSLLFLEEMRQRNQTSYTPNVLTIYLLMRLLKDIRTIDRIEKTIRGRFRKWERFFDEKSPHLNFLIQNKNVRSFTVMAIETQPHLLNEIKIKARDAGFILGEGYGPWKQTTFRIANFPALQRSEIARLMDFLYMYL